MARFAQSVLRANGHTFHHSLWVAHIHTRNESGTLVPDVDRKARK
jgi:hypothetical protein